MNLFTLLLISVGLSMDAFAVSIGNGMCMPQSNLAVKLKTSTAFGLFQGIMPLIGYTVARAFAEQIKAFDHWAALILLGFIGGKMLFEAIKTRNESVKCDINGNPTNFHTLFVMAVATSIDALAVGASVAVLPKTGMIAGDYGYILSFVIIAVITFCLSFVGVTIGGRVGSKFGKKAEIVGGIILIGIGLKIFIEHLIQKI